MNKVINLHDKREPVVKVNPFNLALNRMKEHPLDFKVAETRLYYSHDADIHKSHFESPERKQLIRTDSKTPLAVVGRNYNVLQNNDLFGAIENELISRMPADVITDVQIVDKTAYGGADCFREYRFPNLRDKINEQSEIGFRVIIGNGFGKSAVSVAVGAIDWYCTNGMMIGQAERVVKKHTSGLTVDGLTTFIVKNMEMFHKSAEKWREWNKQKVTPDLVQEFFEEAVKNNMISQRLADKLKMRFMVEANNRGTTKWALYSAMTFYATHTEEGFAVRDTGRDTVASVMQKREVEVMRLVDSKHFQKLAA